MVNKVGRYYRNYDRHKNNWRLEKYSTSLLKFNKNMFLRQTHEDYNGSNKRNWLKLIAIKKVSNASRGLQL